MIDPPEIGRYCIGYAFHGLDLMRVEGVLIECDDDTVTLDPGEGAVKVRVYRRSLLTLT